MDHRAALELQKKAEAAVIQSLEAERAQWQTARVNLERNAVQPIHDALRKQDGDIERQTLQALQRRFRRCSRQPGYVQQSVKEVSWLTIGLMVAGGLVLGLLLGYWPMRRSQNSMQEQLNRIEQYLAA